MAYGHLIHYLIASCTVQSLPVLFQPRYASSVSHFKHELKKLGLPHDLH